MGEGQPFKSFKNKKIKWCSNKRILIIDGTSLIFLE